MADYDPRTRVGGELDNDTALNGDQPARPVEDREPVGPYAPTRNADHPVVAMKLDAACPTCKHLVAAHIRDSGGTIVCNVCEQAGTDRSWLAERFDRIDTALTDMATLKAKMANTCGIDHRVIEQEWLERGRQQGDADRAQRGSVAGFSAGKVAGAAEREAELLDQGWTPPGATVDLVSNGLRSTDQAVVAGIEASAAMGCIIPGSFVGGIINAAIPHLAGAYIAAPEASAVQRPHPLSTAWSGSTSIPSPPVGQAWPVSTDRMVDTHTETIAVEHEFIDHAGPTDYEVWRDALTLAIDWCPAGTSDEDVLIQAEIWRDRLVNYPTISPAEADQAMNDQIDALAETEAAADPADLVENDDLVWDRGSEA